jgi:hypothetical protein
MIEYVLQVFKKYFIPQTGNDNKPHILRPRAIAFFFIVMLVAESAFIFSSTYIAPRSKLFGIIEVTALVDETNQQRAAQGFATLQTSPLLQQVAQDKANDMAANSYFAHTSPSGVTPWDWFEKVGYQFSYAGENLAVDFSNSQDVTNAWMNSPEHRSNIMNSNFTQIGMATAQGTLNGQPATFVAEEFGTPASAPLAFINTAAAATVTNPAPVTTPAKTPSKPAPAPAPKPVTTPTPKPAPAPIVFAPKPIAIAPISVPVVPVAIVVASASVENSSSQQLFVAVKGIETQTVPAAVTTTSQAVTVATTGGVTTTASVPVAAVTTVAPVQKPNSFESALQWLVSNPRAIANDFYLFLIALFIIASILNFFIKIRIQFPKLVLGGMTVVVIAGLCVLMNQNIGLLGAAII